MISFFLCFVSVLFVAASITIELGGTASDLLLWRGYRPLHISIDSNFQHNASSNYSSTLFETSPTCITNSRHCFDAVVKA